CKVERKSAPENAVHLARQLEIQRRQAPGVMCVQPHLDRLVDIGPVGMLIHFLSDQGNLRPEGKGSGTIAEGKDAPDRRSVVGQGPARYGGKSLLDLLRRKLCPARHGNIRGIASVSGRSAARASAPTRGQASSTI